MKRTYLCICEWLHFYTKNIHFIWKNEVESYNKLYNSINIHARLMVRTMYSSLNFNLSNGVKILPTLLGKFLAIAKLKLKKFIVYTSGYIFRRKPFNLNGKLR